MKQILLLAMISFSLSGFIVAQNYISENVKDSSLKNLMGKDIKTVMSTMKISANDTIGMTGMANFPQGGDPQKEYFYIKTNADQLLLFYNNKLSVFINPNSNKRNPFEKQ